MERITLSVDEIILDACKTLNELCGNTIQDVDMLALIIDRYDEFASWARSTGMNLRGFDAYCEALPEAILRTGHALEVDVVPIVSWFNLARAEVEHGLDVQPTGEDSAKVLTAWAQLRFAARSETLQQDTELGVSLRDVFIAMDTSDDELADSVRRFAKSKKIKAVPVGKDGKANLYRLFDILKDFEKYSPLSQSEKRKIIKRLQAVQRKPS